MRAQSVPRLVLIVGILAGVAPGVGRAEPIRPGETSAPIYTLGLIGPSTPDILKAAKANPYADPSPLTCDGIAQEVLNLDEVLGPDADETPFKRRHFNAPRMIGKSIAGLVPHRDVVRFITGAGRMEKALSEAAMAGWARRGYLRGLAHNLGCPPIVHAAPEVLPQKDESAPVVRAAALPPDVEPATPPPTLTKAAAPDIEGYLAQPPR